MEIFSAPDFLILHLKRFSHSRGLWGGRKVTDLVTFPIYGLDMSQHILKNTSGKPILYDLYAVSNHFGSLDGGHYTAYCQNPVFKKWFNFDDSSVSKLSEGEINSKAAYVLFYKKR